MAKSSKLLLSWAYLLPSFIFAQVSPIESGEDFYDLLGLQKIVEGVYEPMLGDLPVTISLDELKAAHKSEFVVALNSKYSLADLRRAADHMHTHNQLPEDIGMLGQLGTHWRFSSGCQQPHQYS